jgi:hypothetical protein
MALMKSKICCLSDIGSLLWSAVPWRSGVTQRRNWKSRSTIIGFMGELLANPGHRTRRDHGTRKGFHGNATSCRVRGKRLARIAVPKMKKAGEESPAVQI